MFSTPQNPEQVTVNKITAGLYEEYLEEMYAIGGTGTSFHRWYEMFADIELYAAHAYDLIVVNEPLLKELVQRTN